MDLLDKKLELMQKLIVADKKIEEAIKFTEIITEDMYKEHNEIAKELYKIGYDSKKAKELKEE